MAIISDYIFNIISDLDDNGKLAFRKTKNERESTPRFRVGLGVIPDYLFDGKGMRIDGVSQGRPAERGGLLKGDVVIKLGDSLVTNMMSYMRALSVFDEEIEKNSKNLLLNCSQKNRYLFDNLDNSDSKDDEYLVTDQVCNKNT